ncbi:calcium-binding protein [Sphingomonas sp. DT-204]|uniref:calcium-binding protein n=1 Tax=Sphingomonas sp. DT-204 TaxID=3396166 RepID=UPI003F1A79EF
MDSIGRFALPSQFDLIQLFFSSSNVPIKIDENGVATFYSKAEIAGFFGLDSYGLTVQQYLYSDGINDYAERVLLWNTGAFKISDDVQFWVDADGNRHIENLAIQPRGEENFDLTSNDFFTQIGNEAYLQDRLDPYHIGRIVNIDFSGDVERRSYDSEDYLSDLQTSQAWITPDPVSALNAISSLVSDLNTDNIISPLDDLGRPIIYGTDNSDNLLDNTSSKPFYDGKSAGGLVFVSGSGADHITAESGTNLIKGGAGNDTIISHGSNDSVYGEGDNDLIKIGSNSIDIHFSAEDGHDVAQYDNASANYNLKLDGLNLEDVSFIAGGVDLYSYGHEIIDYVAFEWIGIKIDATGETIVFSNSDQSIGPSGDAGYDQGGIAYAKSTISLNSIEFENGQIINKDTIWSYIENWKSRDDVFFDLMRSYSGWGNFKGQSYLPSKYLQHLNDTYFQALAISPPVAKTVEGSSDTDFLSDGYGSDVVRGLAGDDYITTGAGDDVVEWTAGDGNDILYSSGAGNGTDTLKLGAGIAVGDLLFSAEGTAIKIEFNGSNGSIYLADELAAVVSGGAHQILFDDGTLWSSAQLIAAASSAIAAAHETVDGTNGSDEIYLPQTNFTAEGHEGDDTLTVFGDGFGTVIFGAGAGSDKYLSYGNRSDTLELTGILPGDVTITRSGPAGFLTIAATGETMEIGSQFVIGDLGAMGGFEAIKFSNGVVWDRDDIETAAGPSTPRPINGTAGADEIYLPYYDAVVDAGLGNDTIVNAEEGTAVIRYAKGDGSDTIGGGYAVRNDTLLLTDLLPQELAITKVGGAAVLTILETGDTIQLLGQFPEEEGYLQLGVDIIRFADGSEWDRGDIEYLASQPTNPPAGNIPYPETTNTVTFDPGAMIGTTANDYIVAPSGPAGGSNGNVLSGLDGNDWMVSESWSSSMDGGVGADVLEVRNSDLTVTGGGGSDHFVFDAGNFVGESWSLDPQYTWATITDFEDGLDKIAVLNTAAGFGALTLTQAGADVEITMAGAPKIVVAQTLVADLTADDFIVRLGGDAGTPPSGDGVVYPTPTNVVSYDSAQMDGTAANDSIFALSSSNGTSLLGRDGDDLLITESWASFVSGGAGNDVIEIRNDDVTAIGGAGYDSFVFDPAAFVGESWALDPGFVWATITGFTSGEDKLAIGSAAYEDLTISQVGDNVEISMDGAPRIILRGTSASDIDASDFIFDTDPQQTLGYADTPMPIWDGAGSEHHFQPEMMTWFA